ncbi:glycogen debranching N-terminal domain-containing protein [Nonomuraea sp. NPDC050556]|uniref:amylo-alpha-1,6-glucosidase n=1 Tax=Nonomuraea sp. NPDC050556 TaxID=3364369 RepID=UPI0037B7CB9F
MSQQPLLHDLVSTVLAPTSALSGADGQIRASGVQGVFHADARVLAQARLEIDGREPVAVGYAERGPGVTRFVSLVRWLGDPGADPTVRVDRTRRVTPGRVEEELEIVSTASVAVSAVVTMTLSCDLARIETVKGGGGTVALEAVVRGDTVEWRSGTTRLTVSGEGAAVGGGAREGGGGGSPGAGSPGGGEVVLLWEVDLAPRGRVVLRWWADVDDPGAVVSAPVTAVEWSRPHVTADDARLVRLASQSLDDLQSLRLAEGGDTFLGAGVPWFLTLFGRDSLWAARMLLPLGTDLAASTLRVLAHRQGTKHDPDSGEAPGKIMHELRRHEFATGGMRLPAAYYGTIDATPLWINLLHDAWRWGLPQERVEALLPAMESALTWLGDHADADGDGFIEYIDTSGRGLANQGWKDSGDAVRFRDGTLARPPIALAEVQGYAHEAAVKGAALLEAFGRPGGERWRDYAGRMADRFRARFWVDGGYPALALDRDKRPVDALTSNIGHLLGTGLLTSGEETLIAQKLINPEMSGGFGLRTMSSNDAGFSPLSYHCGSIWAHDTAIVMAGLARAGYGEAAALLADGLLEAGEAFGYRLPELHAGDDRHTVGRPVAYPAACRPQAWSAAAAITILHAATGLYPDVPNNRVDLRPMTRGTFQGGASSGGAALGAVVVRGMRAAGVEVSVSVDRSGEARVEGLPMEIIANHGRPLEGRSS